MKKETNNKNKLSNSVNLSEVEGSASNAIVKWWNSYDWSSKSPKQVFEDIVQIIPEDKKNEPKVKDLLRKLMNARFIENSAIIIGNFVLSGDHESTLTGFKEKDRKFMKNFGRSR